MQTSWESEIFRMKWTEREGLLCSSASYVDPIYLISLLPNWEILFVDRARSLDGSSASPLIFAAFMYKGRGMHRAHFFFQNALEVGWVRRVMACEKRG